MSPRGHDELDVVTVHLDNVPSADLFDTWQSCVTERLRASGVVDCWVDEAGAVIATVRRDVAAAEFVEYVTAALKAAETEAVEQRAAEETSLQERAAEAAAYREAAASCNLPPWVTEVDLDTAYGRSAAILTLAPTFTSARVCEILRGQPEVAQAYGSAHGGPAIEPPPEPQLLAALLWKVDEVVRPEVEAKERAAAVAARSLAQRTHDLNAAAKVPTV